MRFRSCFLGSNFLVFAFSIAVPKEYAVHQPKQALSVRDNADTTDQLPSVGWSISALTDETALGNTGNIFNPEGAETLPTGPSTASSLLAETFDDGITGGLGALELGVDAAAGTFGAFLEQSRKVNQVLQDDHPSNVKIINTSPSVQTPSKVDERQGEGAGSAATTQTDSDSWCPSWKFQSRTLAWCDLGKPRSIVITPDQGITSVWGYPCTLFPRRCFQSLSSPPPHFLYLYEP